MLLIVDWFETKAMNNGKRKQHFFFLPFSMFRNKFTSRANELLFGYENNSIMQQIEVKN